MAANREGMKIVLQVGAELRIRNNGDVTMDNPDWNWRAMIGLPTRSCFTRFDEEKKEHVLRLVEPVADHQHVKVHRAKRLKQGGRENGVRWFQRFSAGLHPTCGAPKLWKRLAFGFDRVSAAWDNLGFWGYDEPSTDYSRRSIDGRFGFHCHGASAARAAVPTRKPLLPLKTP